MRIVNLLSLARRSKSPKHEPIIQVNNSSVAKFSNSPASLPPELVEMILAHLDRYERKRGLLKCALVSRDWLAWSRPLALSSLGTCAYWLSNEEDVLVLGDRRSTISPLIAHLSIHQGGKKWSGSHKDVIPRLLDRILNNFHHAPSLALNSLAFHYVQFSNLSSRGWNSLREVMAKATLTSITLSNCDFISPTDFLDLISWAHSLACLEISTLGFEQPGSWPKVDELSENESRHNRESASQKQSALAEQSGIAGSTRLGLLQVAKFHKPPRSLLEVSIQFDRRLGYVTSLESSVQPELNDILPWLCSAPALHHVRVFGVRSDDIESLARSLCLMKARLTHLHVVLDGNAGELFLPRPIDIGERGKKEETC
jgi:hypothetical protein